MPRDGLARDLEVEAALAAEAAWGLKEAVASMAWSIDMDVYSPLHLPTELVGNGSISANKVCLLSFLCRRLPFSSMSAPCSWIVFSDEP
jgi:hypothetical protein